MIYGYVIDFPSGEHASGEVPGPSIQVVSATDWEPSVFVYRYDGWNQRFLHIVTMGDAAHRSEITLPVTKKGATRYLFRIVHKKGGPHDSLPWFSSNNVLLYHGPQNVHERTSASYRPMIVKIVGDDENPNDPNDVMVYLSYGGAGWADIKAVTARLEEGFHTPPQQMAVEV